MHSKLKKILYVMGIAAIFTSTSVFAFHFPEDEDTEFGVSASRSNLVSDGLQIPLAEEDGKIPTLNQTGFMTPDQNPYNLSFIDFAATRKYPVLDIGAAYGLTTLPALYKGAQVIANDIDPRHLLLLREQAEQESRKRLFLNKRKFPNETEFPNNSIGAILLCRVAHFLSGEDMDQAITKMTRWLVPGGRIFVVTMSPYHHLLTELLPGYLGKAEKNIAWPGVINNMHEIAPHLKTQIPNFLHVMDHQSLGKAFERHGLKILEESLFDYTRPKAKKSDGKGYYGIIVEKKN
ncbi:MAG: class I SAM-dependent methyltransferase [Thermodesulfobium sp.]